MVECTLLGASIFPFDLKKGLFNNPRYLKDLNAKVQYASTKDMKKKYFCLTISTFPFGGSSHMYLFIYFVHCNMFLLSLFECAISSLEHFS